MKCPKCDYENKDDAAYCGLCYEVLRKEHPNIVPPVPENIKILPKKSYTRKITIVSALIIAGLTFLLFIQWATLEFIPTYRIKKQQAQHLEELRLREKTRLENFKPYSGETDTIKVNPITDIGGLAHDAFAKFRKSKVKEYSLLNIFPEDYGPFNGQHNNIYGQITPYANWVEGARFYICNPYLLIILSCANHITPLAFYCRNKENIKVKYSNRKIEEIYEGREALNWFNTLYSYDDYPGIIRVWMVNAKDAGLRYACIDKNKTINVDFDWSSSANSIVNSAYTCGEFFHVGKYNLNNLSPANMNGRIKLLGKNRYTCIYIKLWMVKPVDITQEEDFAYVVKIIP